MHLLFLQDEGSGAIWIWLIIILIPMLGRIAGWVIEKLGGGPANKTDPADRQRQKDTRRERAQELERRGQEMWKRLVEGEGEAPQDPPAAAPPARPEPRPATVVRSAPRPEPRRAPMPHDELPSADRIPTLERELVGTRPSERMPALERLQHHQKSDLRAASDLEADEEVSELARVDYLQALRERPDTPADTRTRIAPPRDAADWRQAVIWSEILRPPVSMRDPDREDLPALR